MFFNRATDISKCDDMLLQFVFAMDECHVAGHKFDDEYSSILNIKV